MLGAAARNPGQRAPLPSERRAGGRRPKQTGGPLNPSASSLGGQAGRAFARGQADRGWPSGEIPSSGRVAGTLAALEGGGESSSAASERASWPCRRNLATEARGRQPEARPSTQLPRRASNDSRLAKRAQCAPCKSGAPLRGSTLRDCFHPPADLIAPKKAPRAGETRRWACFGWLEAGALEARRTDAARFGAKNSICLNSRPSARA